MTAGPPFAARVRATARAAALFAVMAVVAMLNPPAACAADPADVQVTSDVAYGTDQGQQLLLDIYEPAASSAPAPILLVIHGGGWISGDKDEYGPFSRSLAAAGLVVFDVNYSLDTRSSPAYPREVNDVRAALTWVRAHAAERGGDTSRIGVLGGSAGGYLAAMLGTEADTRNVAPVRAVVSLSGPMDIAALVAGARNVSAPATGECLTSQCTQLRLAATRLHGLLGCDPEQCPGQLLRDASPVAHASATSPPFFLANSTNEIVPADQATGMATALRSHGIAVDVQLIPGDRHAIAYLPEIREALTAFLGKHLAKAASTAQRTPPTSRQTGYQAQHAWSRPGAIRWLVVIGVLGLLAVAAAIRRRVSRSGRIHGR